MSSLRNAERISAQAKPSWVVTGPAATMVSTIAQATTRQAILDMRAGNHKAAIAALTSIVESTGDWVCQFWLAIAYMSSGNQRQARRRFVYIAEGCPNVDFRKLAMGMLLVIERAENALITSSKLA